MSKIRIVADSASDLRGKMAEELGIEVVPLSIRFGDEVFIDNEEISISQFYTKMAESKELPSTAAPSPGDFAKAFEKTEAEGAETVICITLSSKLSATGQSAIIAAREYPSKLNIINLDSNSVTAGQALLTIEAAKMAQEGQSEDSILSHFEQLKSKLKIFGVLNTLENLRRGGRIGGARAMLGSLLDIKPIVDISSGEVQEAGRVRTRKKAFAWLKNKLAEQNPGGLVAIGHGNADDFQELLDSLDGVVDLSNAWIGEIGPTVGAHTGAGVVGISYLEN